MVRIDDVSPAKKLRRSTRERSTVYRSLEENELVNVNSFIRSDLFGRLIDRANRERRRSSQEVIEPGYTRSGRQIKNYVYDSTEDEEDENMVSSRRTSSRPAKRIMKGSAHEDDEEVSGPRRPQKKAKVESDEEEEEPSQNGSESTSLYDRVKRHRTSPKSIDSTPIKSPLSNGTAKPSGSTERSQRALRRAHVQEENDVKSEQHETEDEEEEEDVPKEKETRKGYSLRTNRAPVERFRINFRPRNDRDRDRRRQSEHEWRSRGRSEYKNRMCRSDSSSTGDEHDGREMRKSRNRRTGDDEDRFERRKDISMMKARNRFVPINLTSKDLSTSSAVIKERMRQSGASCSDVDPMAVDKDISFEQVGGLGAHIQSLKEIVLFPMLYPDVFGQFDISPPKGVIFYGPPGTGKTLVARALANECSKGNKKVAFFMRKGADCLSKWVGESERQLRILFDQAYSMRPSIIFFDEIDGLAPVRSSRQDQIHSSIVSTLLALMDGLDNRGEVIVIGATNRLDSIDPALRRPGRFDRELCFNLPDVSSRREILNIHTSKWGENKPNNEMIEWIASNTSGYCGADLRFLCTEAILLSLRSRYPHIYLSSERLKLDISSIRVKKNHLVEAMKRIVPASRRDLSILSRPLDDRTSILLSSIVDTLIATRIPSGYRTSQSIMASSTNALEKVVRALEPPPAVQAVRLMLTGCEHFADGGQTSYVLPAILSRLDHLPVYSIAVSKLFADGRPEEAFAVTFQSAIRSAASGPCILLLPSIDQWFNVVPTSVSHMLATALDQTTGFTSILFLATSDTPYDELKEEVSSIFRQHNCARISTIPKKLREEYFKFVMNGVKVPPKVFDESKYIEPEKASSSDAPVRKLSEKEASELEKLYENQLREFRIFLRDQLGRLVRDRRFNVFAEPVDVEEAEDYYDVIEHPMCLADMMEKVDRREYNHPDQFLSDIQLIVTNALEYNPADSLYSKTIRHNAVALRDIVEEYFEKEFDEDFVDRLEETARLLKEAEMIPKNGQLLNIPDGSKRKKRWTVSEGFKKKLQLPPRQETSKGKIENNSSMRKVIPTKRTLSIGARRRFRRGTYNFPSSRKKKSRAIVQSIADSLGKSTPIENENTEENMETSERNCNSPVDEPSNEKTRFSPKFEVNDKNQLTFDAERLDKLISKAADASEYWPVPELERFAAEIVNHIDFYRNEWDRSKLLEKIENVLCNWKYPPI